MNVNAIGIFIMLFGVVLAIGLVLVFRYRWFVRQMEKEEKNVLRVPILNDKPSYEKYKRIASIKSVRSEPVRKEGDFLDFILSYDNENDANAIESKLAEMEVGESLESA